MDKHKQDRKRGYGPAGAALVASLVLMGGSLAVTAGSAFAGTPIATSTASSVPVTTAPASNATLAQLQAEGAAAINRRLDSLSKAVKDVQADTYLGGDQATLVSHLQAEIAGLQALGSKIAADTTVAEARADFGAIFSTYRVYRFELRDVSLVAQTDHIVNVGIPGVQKRVDAISAKLGANPPPKVAQLVKEAQAKVTDATTATSGVSAQLLTYTASDWDANHNLLSTSSSAARSAEWDLVVARYDVARAGFLLNHPGRSTNPGGRRGHGHPNPGTVTTTTVTSSSTTTTAP